MTAVDKKWVWHAKQSTTLPQKQAASPPRLKKHAKEPPAPPTPEDVIHARQDRVDQMRTVIAFLVKLCVVILTVWLVFTLAFGMAVMQGNDMYPRILDGDVMLYYRLEATYHIGDVVTFVQNETRFTGRIVAMGGDGVDISDNGDLLVNGNIQSEEIFYPTEKEAVAIALPFTVEPDSVFLLCDLRTGGTDSRSYGAIPITALDGKVITILRRRGI